MSYSKRAIILFSFFILGLSHLGWAANLPFINKAKIRLFITPGEQAYGEIMVENPTADVRPMRLYLEDWYYLPAGDGSKEFAPADTTRHSCASWITFSPAEFTLAPFGRQRVGYSIKVPPEAKGGYYAVLFFESILGEAGAYEAETAAAGINLRVRIATLFYVEAEGTIKRTGELESFTLNRASNSEPLFIEANFRNTGNVDITAVSSFHIMDSKGMVYARGEFNNVYTFAQETAGLSATWREPIPSGKYDLILTLDLGKALEELGLGRGPVLTKEAEIEIGENGEVVKVGKLQ